LKQEEAKGDQYSLLRLAEQEVLVVYHWVMKVVETVGKEVTLQPQRQIVVLVQVLEDILVTAVMVKVMATVVAEVVANPARSVPVAVEELVFLARAQVVLKVVAVPAQKNMVVEEDLVVLRVVTLPHVMGRVAMLP